MVEKFNFIDKITSKQEASIGLAIFGIGTIFAVVGLDYATLIMWAEKTAVSLPNEVHASAALIATALLGYIIGKKA